MEYQPTKEEIMLITRIKEDFKNCNTNICTCSLCLMGEFVEDKE